MKMLLDSFDLHNHTLGFINILKRQNHIVQDNNYTKQKCFSIAFVYGAIHLFYGFSTLGIKGSNLPCATFSYCPLDLAECKTVWKRFDKDVIPFCSLVLLIFPSSAPIDSSPMLLARLFWFSLFAIAAKRRRFGLGSWKISCQMENKLRCESF